MSSAVTCNLSPLWAVLEIGRRHLRLRLEKKLCRDLNQLPLLLHSMFCLFSHYAWNASPTSDEGKRPMVLNASALPTWRFMSPLCDIWFISLNTPYTCEKDLWIIWLLTMYEWKKCVSVALARATRKLVGFHMKWGLESWSPIDAGGLPLDLPLALSAVAHTVIPSQILLFNLQFMGWCNTPQRSLSPSGGWMWRSGPHRYTDPFHL